MEAMTYEEAIKRLEEIVSLLENNEIALEDSIALFQEGIKLSKICNDKLNNIEDKVAKILVDDKLEDLEIEDKNG